MKDFWINYKFFIIVFLYFSGVIAGGRFLAMPLVSSIKEKSYQVQAKAIDREMEKDRINKLPELKKEWSDYESQENITNVILGKDDQVSFIENVEAIADKTGNKIELKIKEDAKIAATTATKGDVAKKTASDDYFQIQISLDGNYASLVNFIHLLENSQFYVNILTISSSKNISQNNNNVNINPFNIQSAPGSNGDGGSDQIIDKEFIKTDITAIVYIQKQ